MIYKKYVKRMIDIILSFIGMPLFLFLFVVFAPMIYFPDKGPVFYNAPRLGKNGKIYKMLKFRSMKVNAPDIRNSDGSTFNGDNDPRVTKIGCFMRKTSIDEAPQIINVFCGDMSFIGPRPNLPTSSYDDLPQIQKDRIAVRPGITGYNQAYFRNSVTTDQKFQNDIYYIKNISFLLDLKIFFKTIYTVLKRDNINISKADAPEIHTEQNDTDVSQGKTKA